MGSDVWLTVEEAAELAGVSVEEIIARIEDGTLPAKRIIRHYRCIRRYWSGGQK